MKSVAGSEARQGWSEVKGEIFSINSDPGTNTPYPRIDRMGDGRLVVSHAVNVSPRFFVHGGREVLCSVDDGATWNACEDPMIPANWPGSSTRERYDRMELILPDGSWAALGVVGWQAWKAEDEPKAREQGRYVTAVSPPGQPGLIGVGTNTMFIQRSSDQGGTWSRREIELPAAGWTLGLPRNIRLADGTIVMPLRQRSHDALRGHLLVARVSVESDSERFRIHSVPRDLEGRVGSESAIAEVGPDQLVMLIRADSLRGGDGRMLTSWSEDGGRSWTIPLGTEITGWAPHLVTLNDGRLLCTYGHHVPPFGVRAVISSDGGQTWETDTPIQIVTVEEHGDGAFHPMTVQLDDGRLYTVYYDSAGGSCNSMGVRWSL